MSRITSRNTKPGIIVRSIKKGFYAGNLDFALCSALVTQQRFASIRPSNSPLGYEQIRPSQTRHWPRAHFCLPAGFPTSARCSLHRGFPFKKPDQKQINLRECMANFYKISRNLHIEVQKRPAREAGYCPSEMEAGNFCARVLLTLA